jgi:hypothetical protein
MAAVHTAAGALSVLAWLIVAGCIIAAIVAAALLL